MKQTVCRQQSWLHFTPLLAMFFLVLLFPPNISAEIVDKVIAVVNDEVITLSELEREMSGVFRSISEKHPDKPVLDAMEEAREITLNGMIERALIEQKAKSFNVTVTKNDVDAAYERIRSSLSLEPTEFRKKLVKSGLTEESYRDKLRTQIMQNRLLSLDVKSKIVVTEEMILDYYDEHYTSRVDKGSFYLLQIGCSWDKSGDFEKQQTEKQEARERIERVHGLAAKGQDFKTLARKFSDLPSAEDGGDIGIFSLDEMAPAMQNVVRPLQPGDISEIIESPAGFQFFKSLSGKEDAIVVTAPLETVKEEIREKIFEEKLQVAFPEWVKKLKEDAYIQRL